MRWKNIIIILLLIADTQRIENKFIVNQTHTTPHTHTQTLVHAHNAIMMRLSLSLITIKPTNRKQREPANWLPNQLTTTYRAEPNRTWSELNRSERNDVACWESATCSFPFFIANSIPSNCLTFLQMISNLVIFCEGVLE